MTTNLLAQLNHLQLCSDQIWVESNKQQFNYSDGVDNEQNVLEILKKTMDLSVHSNELARDWQDKVLNYHLSAKRSRIIYPVDFTNVNNVLEIGGGFGAITRYLGETGKNIDMIEGSQNRAKAARLRTADQDNVNIFSTNFNNTSLPDNHYQLALFIGVLEYAKRFTQNSDCSHEQAVVDMLIKTSNSITQHGAIVIAIENRLGLKYIFGASEDHYGVPYVGLDDYPQVASSVVSQAKHGIKTFDKATWYSLLSEAGLNAEFYYPFPDYKSPSAIVSDDFLNSHRNAYGVLRKSFSSDFFHPGFQMPVSENQLRGYLSQCNTLDLFSNSFLIIATKNSSKNPVSTKNEFAIFPSERRKKEFSFVTYKNSDSKSVQKTKYYDIENKQSNHCKTIQYQYTASEYLDGDLLSEHWVKCLRSFPEIDVLIELLTNYHDYINTCFDRSDNSASLLDLTPMNIIYSKSQYQYFDQEWALISEPLSQEMVFFRGLFYFMYTYKPELTKFCALFDFRTCEDFVNFGMKCMGYLSKANINEYKILEQKIQLDVHATELLPDVDKMLNESIINPSFFGLNICPQLFWSKTSGVFNPVDKVEHELTIDNNVMDLLFEIDSADIETGGIYFRFDPSDHNTELVSCLIEVLDINVNGLNTQICSLDQITQLNHRLLQINGIDPKVFFHAELKQNSKIRVKIQFEWLAQMNFKRYLI